MDEIRHEKIKFGRGEVTPLDAMPSATSPDALVLRSPRRRSLFYIGCRLVFSAILLVAVLLGAALFAVENGSFDTLLSGKAESTLNSALGKDFKAKVGSTVMRLAPGGHLALVARDVSISKTDDPKPLLAIGEIRIAVGTLAMLRGSMNISSVEIAGVVLDVSLLPARQPLDLSQLRIDQMPQAMETAFQGLDRVTAIIGRLQTRSLSVSGLSLDLPGPQQQVINLTVNDLRADLSDDLQSIEIAGGITLQGHPATLALSATGDGTAMTALNLQLRDLALTPLSLRRNAEGVARLGVDGAFDLALAAQRQTETAQPALNLGLGLESGRFFIEGQENQLDQLGVALAYDFDRKQLEIARSTLQFGQTQIPFSGGFIDLDRLPGDKGKGFGIDIIVENGIAAADGNGEKPLPFNAKISGRFDATARAFVFDNLAFLSAEGSLAGSSVIKLGDSSPEISLAADTASLSARAIKQVWPYWLAFNTRRWALSHIFGGRITNGSIGLFIPAGRLAQVPRPATLSDKELQISFDADGLRLDTIGELPPLRDVVGHLDLKGSVVTMTVKEAKTYLASDRVVDVSDVTFTIPDTHAKPLMASLEIGLSGKADALGELASFKPIQALQRTGMTPQDLSGTADARLSVLFGLIKTQNPPKPVWKAGVDLSDVSLAKPMNGRKITGVTGHLDLDPQRASLKADIEIDGADFDIDLVQPIEPGSKIEKSQVISGTLNQKAISAFAPGLDRIITAPITAKLTRIDDKKQAVEIDLAAAKLFLPGIGWSKGAGVPARAKFDLINGDNGSSISGFSLQGDGFGARGKMEIAKGALMSADLDFVQLAPGDDFSLTAKRRDNGYDLNISGRSADIRPLLDQAKSPGGGAGNGTATMRIKVNLDQVKGFNQTSLNTLTGTVTLSGGKVAKQDLSAITQSGQAVVASISGLDPGSEMTLTCGDAGSLARFAGIYRNLQGGLLNLRLKRRGETGWLGSADLRKFSLSGEESLQKIVEAPVGKDGKSLNQVVRRDIDVSSEKFSRGFASIRIESGNLAVENGILRGDQVGVAFQGIVRDANGQMNLTGTFMPAYGLNRLFSELPLIGAILGNGRDRGLIGITFRMEGKFEKPKLSINPFSLIAPGVFRNIFEFE